MGSSGRGVAGEGGEMTGRSEAEAGLRMRLGHRREGTTVGRIGPESGPASIYEAVTRQMVESLTADLREIKGRLNGLLFMVAGAIVVDIALRVVNGG